MQCNTGQWIVGMLVLNALAAPAFAQAVPAPLPPLSAPAVTLPGKPDAPMDAAAMVAQQPPSMISSVLPQKQEGTAGNEAPNNAASVPNKVYSYGDSSLSILFLPNQIEHMKTALRVFENSGREAHPNLTPTVTAPAAEAKIDEPTNYPVFYLASIAYDKPSDWSLWISGHKITSRHNDTDLEVIAVSPDSVTFGWTPTYNRAIARRQSTDAFAPVAPVKNKLAANQSITTDETTGRITFTLRANQAFAVGYFHVFEGYIATPKLDPLVIATPVPGSGAAGSPTAAAETPGAAGAPTAPARPGMPATAMMPPNMRPTPNGMAPVNRAAPGMMPQGMPPAVGLTMPGVSVSPMPGAPTVPSKP